MNAKLGNDGFGPALILFVGLAAGCSTAADPPGAVSEADSLAEAATPESSSTGLCEEIEHGPIDEGEIRSLLAASTVALGLNAPELTFGIHWDPGQDAKFFVYRRVELDPTTNEVLSSDEVYSVRFSIRAVCVRPNGEAFVGGTNQLGETVIERFRFPACRGGYVTDMPTYPPVLGIPMPDVLSLSASIVGPQFTHPDLRFCQPVEREEIYSGAEIAALRGLLAEPEGRFLIAVGEGTLHQILSSPGASASAIDPSLDPLTAGLLSGGASCAWHATEGKKYSFHIRGREQILVMHDYDNDAVFDAITLEYESDIDETPTDFEGSILHRYETTF